MPLKKQDPTPTRPHVPAEVVISGDLDIYRRALEATEKRVMELIADRDELQGEVAEAAELIEASYGEGHEDKWHRRETRADFALAWLARTAPKDNGAPLTDAERARIGAGLSGGKTTDAIVDEDRGEGMDGE